MTGTRWNTRDLVAGVIVLGVGLYYIAESLTYTFGTMARVGPGMFPFGLGVILSGLGVAILLVDGRTPQVPETQAGGPAVAWRAVIFLPAAVMVFALIIQRLGLAPATFLAVIISTLADRTVRPPAALILAVIITVVCVLIFRVGLGLQAPVFVW